MSTRLRVRIELAIVALIDLFSAVVEIAGAENRGTKADLCFSETGTARTYGP